MPEHTIMATDVYQWCTRPSMASKT